MRRSLAIQLVKLAYNILESLLFMKEKILFLLKEQQPDFDFEEDVDFISEGYLDSFDVISLVADFENEFSIIISALNILPKNFSSVQAISDLVVNSKKRPK